MRLNYVIQFSKGRENVVADALSRCHEEGSSVAITAFVPDWYQKVPASYERGEWTKELLEQLSIDDNSKPRYTILNGLLRYQGRLVAGDCENLRKRILQTLYESPIRGHLGIQNTYMKVKQVFY